MLQYIYSDLKMLSLNLSFSTALNPFFTNPKWCNYNKTLKPLPKHRTVTYFHKPLKSLPIQIPSPRQKPDSHCHRLLPPAAGRSKKNPSTTRIAGSAEIRRDAKRNARRKSKKLAESLFYRLKNPNRNYPDNFSEEELQLIGLGYDRMVRFMSKDDPNLKHPYDWYKYGEFGPYSWRGIVLGDPVRGRMTDECAHIVGSVRDQEEWDEIEQHDMAVDFGNRLNSLSKDVGLQHFWVFVRHPKWRLSDLPWEQWTLVCEVVLEAGNQRLDKWSLMGRLGNKTRELITKCAAWFRPDIIYVKRPVYQSRFEPQANFFRPLIPFLDPKTEQDYLFELEDDQGRVELCTYFGGLCKIVRVSPKAFVDDVVKAYDKLSDERKSKCLEFLLLNHPIQLLHPYTKEWKTKLEDMELGCDAPDEDDDDAFPGGNFHSVQGEKVYTDWVEDEGDGNNDNDGDDDSYDSDDDIVIDANQVDDVLEPSEEDDELEPEEEDLSPEEEEKYWKEEIKKAMTSNDAMQKLVKTSMEKSSELYEKQLREMKGREKVAANNDDGDELALRGKRAKVSPEEWKTVGLGSWRKRVKKSRIPPDMFLRAAVRPFTYRNLVKEIVLARHAILDGEIAQ